jgi:ubiquinone/menaquinone biosynthesis C-methylase UbiE
MPTLADDHRLVVPETRFGVWFLSTRIWVDHVLKVAIRDLVRLIDQPKSSYPVIVDVGCGQGRSFRLLRDTFHPELLIGLDVEAENLAIARQRVKDDGVEVKLLRNDCAEISLNDGIADLLFCHQSFHHLVRQEAALAEYYRILKPTGLLLFAESTRAYIHSWIIRWLFAHPMDVQRTAQEYQAMIRAQGFRFEAKNISYPYLWWSRPDLGMFEFFGKPPKPPGQREETLLNLVAYKPA